MNIFEEPEILFEEISDSDILLVSSETSGEDPWGDDVW